MVQCLFVEFSSTEIFSLHKIQFKILFFFFGLQNSQTNINESDYILSYTLFCEYYQNF